MLGTQTGSTEKRTTTAEIYKEKNVAVKRSIRKDNKNYTDNLAKEAQSAAERGDIRTNHQGPHRWMHM